MYWNELTSPEIGALDRNLPIVIPLASCEQHGRHLPVFVDTLEVQAIVQRVHERLGSGVAILPALWLGSSHHHLDFPGTISVRPTLYSEIIQEMARCLLKHGFRRLFFLNGHGGNLIPTSQALSDLIVSDETADDAQIALASWWSVAASAMEPEKHNMESPRLTHACEYETSLVMAIREDLVKLSALDPKHLEKPRVWVADSRWKGKVEGFYRFHRWTSSGHMGKPEKASRAKGESLLAAVSEVIAEFVLDFQNWPTMDPIRNDSQEGMI